jgi:uncharacterized metal-binding protein YceD (DUF177 family)
MRHRREFEIAFVGLKPGVHVFNYEVDDRFFEDFEQSDFTQPKAKVKLSLEKNTSFMMLKFEVGGNVDVVCDRCGNNLTMDLWDEFNMIVKLVDNPDEMNENEEDPDIYYISRTESHLHIANWIYEFVTLSVPMQKMCTIEEMGGPQCNKEVLDMLAKMREANNPNNPLSKGLEKLKSGTDPENSNNQIEK